MKWMVTIRLIPRDAQQQTEMVALIPQEQAHIKELREQHIVDALYISADRRLVWLVMEGDSQEQVQQRLETLPLYPYMQTEVTQLL